MAFQVFKSETGLINNWFVLEVSRNSVGSIRLKGLFPLLLWLKLFRYYYFQPHRRCSVPRFNVWVLPRASKPEFTCFLCLALLGVSAGQTATPCCSLHLSPTKLSWVLRFTCMAQASEHTLTYTKGPWGFTTYLTWCERHVWMQVFPQSGGWTISRWSLFSLLKKD